MTEYLDPDTFEPAAEPQSWRCDPAFLMDLMDTLLGAMNQQSVRILTAYYAGITTGRWPKPGRNERYNPGWLWHAELVPELCGWNSRKGKLSPETRTRMRQLATRRHDIELHLMRQIMEAYFLAKRQAGAPFPARHPEAVSRREARAAAIFRTR